MAAFLPSEQWLGLAPARRAGVAARSQLRRCTDDRPVASRAEHGRSAGYGLGDLGGGDLVTRLAGGRLAACNQTAASQVRGGAEMLLDRTTGTDEELIERTLAGEISAFEDLVE